jgi:hypothetical protein
MNFLLPNIKKKFLLVLIPTSILFSTGAVVDV